MIVAERFRVVAPKEEGAPGNGGGIKEEIEEAITISIDATEAAGSLRLVAWPLTNFRCSAGAIARCRSQRSRLN